MSRLIDRTATAARLSITRRRFVRGCRGAAPLYRRVRAGEARAARSAGFRNKSGKRVRVGAFAEPPDCARALHRGAGRGRRREEELGIDCASEEAAFGGTSAFESAGEGFLQVAAGTDAARVE